MRERGNILFLILLAVILFAALSYAVSSSMKGGGNNASDEKAEATAATVLQILTGSSVGLERFLLTGRYNIEQIDMYIADGVATGTGNANSCTTSACNLHDPAGANVPAPILPLSAKATDISLCPSVYFNTRGEPVPYYMITSVLNVGTGLPEIIAFYCGISPAVCAKINTKLGIRDSGDSGVTMSIGTAGTGYREFTSTHTSPMIVTTANQVGGVGNVDNRLSGQRTFCWENVAAGYGNYLVHVMYAR